MMNIAAALVGIVLVIGFVAVIVVWLKSVPLSIIAILVLAAMLFDVLQTLRANKQGADR